MKWPTRKQQQELSHGSPRSNSPDATEHRLQLCAPNGLVACFTKNSRLKARWAHRHKAYVPPPAAIDVVLEQRYDIMLAEHQKGVLTYWIA